MTLPQSQHIVSGLSFSYGETLIFDQFDLPSSAQKIVLKGPSGCGKTTLLKILFGSITANKDACLPSREGAALVLQNDALFPWMTGRENIHLLLPKLGLALEAHPLFPVVAGFIDRRAHAMSYGQRRAIELLRAILLAPKRLYLDEPFNYLDDLKAQAFVDYFTQNHVADLLVITTHRNDASLDREADTFSFKKAPPYQTLERS